MEHPEKYPQLTIRVSGYAVNFVRLTREQQLDVIQPHLPRQLLGREHACRTSAWWRSAAATTCAPAARPMRPTKADFERTEDDASAGSTPTRPARRWTGRASGSSVFMSGCLLRCQYCHNPDTWHLKDGTRIESGARRPSGSRDFAPALRAMGGGLTISGGEPLVQTGFTRGLFAAAKRMGLHTALDTSGFLGDAATTTI